VLVITGPSGVGKGTLIRGLLQRMPGLELSVSATTRPPRPGEVDGRDYYFLSEDEFQRRVDRGEFVEHATYAGHRYGTLRSELERPACAIVLEIDLQGARQVREALPEATQVFIAPPSLEELRRRLERRAAETPEQIRQRLAAALAELAAQREFAHVVVNDDVQRALDELERLAATMCPPGAGAEPSPGGERT
jgi:guanylate kinase